MHGRGWTTAELAALHDELLTIAATTSRAIASGTAISMPARAPHHPAQITLLSHLQNAATAVSWRTPVRPTPFRSWLSVAESFRALAYSRTSLLMPVVVPAAFFGGLTAATPFGVPLPRFLQIVLSVLFAASVLAWLWDAWLRHRIMRGPLDWLPRSQQDLIRILKVGARLTLVLNLTLAALAVSASISNLGLLTLLPWMLIITAAPIGVFSTTSLAAADGRAAAASRRLLTNDPLRYAIGVVPTLSPCLLALLAITVLLFNDPFATGYNLPAAITLAALFAGALLHAEYLATVYAHATGIPMPLVPPRSCVT